jgi:hypothetical protein
MVDVGLVEKLETCYSSEESEVKVATTRTNPSFRYRDVIVAVNTLYAK